MKSQRRQKISTNAQAAYDLIEQGRLLIETFKTAASPNTRLRYLIHLQNDIDRLEREFRVPADGAAAVIGTSLQTIRQAFFSNAILAANESLTEAGKIKHSNSHPYWVSGKTADNLHNAANMLRLAVRHNPDGKSPTNIFQNFGITPVTLERLAENIRKGKSLELPEPRESLTLATIIGNASQSTCDLTLEQ